MTWVKGISGNPLGRGSSGKIITDALRRAIHETDKKTGALKVRIIADKVVAAAMKGEPWAFNALADRVEGKPAQETNLNVNDKRSATDWSRGELVALLDEYRARGKGNAAQDGGVLELDSVHDVYVPAIQDGTTPRADSVEAGGGGKRRGRPPNAARSASTRKE